jgi:hypothetical protein
MELLMADDNNDLIMNNTSHIRGVYCIWTAQFVNHLKNYQLNWQRKGRRLRRSVGQTGEPLTAARGGL